MARNDVSREVGRRAERGEGWRKGEGAVVLVDSVVEVREDLGVVPLRRVGGDGAMSCL